MEVLFIVVIVICNFLKSSFRGLDQVSHSTVQIVCKLKMLALNYNETAGVRQNGGPTKDIFIWVVKLYSEECCYRDKASHKFLNLSN